MNKINSPFADIVAFTNDIAIGHDGWAQLAPFGDYPGTALARKPDGSVEKFPAIQRLDRAAAEGMIARFKSPWQRLKRYITGCPVFVGHPDVPAFANDYPDKSPKGMIVDLQVRGDGLYCKPVFTNEGSELVETGKFRAFSGYWSAEFLGEETVNGEPANIYRPELLKSAGLTNNPNLPVHLMNSKTINSIQPPHNTNPAPIVNKQILVNFLASVGITIANEASDDQILAALQEKLRNALFDDQAQSLRAELANERQFHIATLLDNALASGSITAVERPAWVDRLTGDFANASAELAKRAPALKTRPVTAGLGQRKAEVANISERRDAVDALVRAEMAVNGGDYNCAFIAVQKANPALFVAMKQPAYSVQ